MVQSHKLKSQTSCNYVPVNFFLHFATACSVSLKTRAPQRQVFANIWKCFGLLLSIGHGSKSIIWRRTMLMTLTLPVETDSWKKDISSCCRSLFQRDEFWSATATLFRNNFQQGKSPLLSSHDFCRRPRCGNCLSINPSGHEIPNWKTMDRPLIGVT